MTPVTTLPAARLISLNKKERIVTLMTNSGQRSPIFRWERPGVGMRRTASYGIWPVQYTVGHKRLLRMEVFVVHVPHNSICVDNGEEEDTHHMIKNSLNGNPRCWLSFQLMPVRTTVDHDSKLLQEKVDISVIFHFSSFTEHDQHISPAVQVVLQHLQLQ